MASKIQTDVLHVRLPVDVIQKIEAEAEREQIPKGTRARQILVKHYRKGSK